MTSSSNRATAGIILIISLGVIAYAIRYIALALSTGSVPGKLGAVYQAPDYHFYTFIGFAGIGALLGLILLRLSLKWIRQG